MQPYYEDEWVTLYHGDCLELNAWLSADVLVTDPPYGMGYVSHRLHKAARAGVQASRMAGDADTQARNDALAAWGDVRPSLVFGRWSIPKPAGVKQVIIWEKGNHTGMGDTNIPWRPNTEEIYVRGTWPQRAPKGRGGGGRASGVLSVTATAALSAEMGRLHPTEKPLGLLEKLIERVPPGVIADPFAGSGSTLLAARNLGRQAIGVELEEVYCETIAKRLQQQAFDFASL